MCEKTEELQDPSRKGCAVPASHVAGRLERRSRRAAGRHHRGPGLLDTEGSRPCPPHRAAPRSSHCWCGTWRTERASKGPVFGASLGKGHPDTRPAVPCGTTKSFDSSATSRRLLIFCCRRGNTLSPYLVCGAQRNTSFTKHLIPRQCGLSSQNGRRGHIHAGQVALSSDFTSSPLSPKNTSTIRSLHTEETLLREPLERIELPSAESSSRDLS